MNQNWISKTACVLCITAKISDDRVTALRPSRTAGVNRRRRRASVLSCASGGGGVKRGEFRATARAVGPTRHWCVSVTPPPRLPPRPRRRAGTPTVEPVRSRRGPPERDRGPGQYKPAGAPDQFVFSRHTANRRCPRRGRQSSLVIVTS